MSARGNAHREKVALGPVRHVECERCGQFVISGQPETHSNRCSLYGGHSEERCESCRVYYRPPKGWEGEICPTCRGEELRAVPEPTPVRKSYARNIYSFGSDGKIRPAWKD